MATFAEVVVEEIMNPQPVVLRSSQSLKEAVHVMLDANVAGAPVVDDAGQLVGVLSEADLIIKVAAQTAASALPKCSSQQPASSSIKA